jgi:hypothetical protein
VNQAYARFMPRSSLWIRGRLVSPLRAGRRLGWPIGTRTRRALNDNAGGRSYGRELNLWEQEFCRSLETHFLSMAKNLRESQLLMVD